MVSAHFAGQRFGIREPAGAGMRAAGLNGQRVQAASLVAFAPRRDRLPRDAEAFGDLTDRCAVVDFGDGAQSDLNSDARCNIGI